MFENWLFLALLAPFFWAWTNVIDTYFVGGIYKDEYDGIIISGIFQIVPWILTPVLGIEVTSVTGMLLAIAGGFFFTLGTFFYFRAMFAHADAALVVIIWSMVGVVVPVMEAMAFGERLAPMQYFGIAIVFLGAILLSADSNLRKKKLGKIYVNMIWAVLFCSVAFILEDKAYKLVSFWNGTLSISLGSFTCGILFWAIRPGKKNGHIRLTKKYYKIFLLAESLALAGMIANYRAIETGVVSLVSAVGNIQPAWIMIISWAIYFVARLLRLNNTKALQTMRDEQIASWKVKLIAVVAMAIGIYLVK